MMIKKVQQIPNNYGVNSSRLFMTQLPESLRVYAGLCLPQRNDTFPECRKMNEFEKVYRGVEVCKIFESHFAYKFFHDWLWHDAVNAEQVLSKALHQSKIIYRECGNCGKVYAV